MLNGVSFIRTLGATGLNEMSKLDLKILELWCQHAITVLVEAGLTEQTAKLMRVAISRCSGKVKLYEVANELSDALNDLPSSNKVAAQESLRAIYGFGFDIFIEEKGKRLLSIIRRGRVRDESELRVLNDFAADTTIGMEVARVIDELIANYSPKL